MKNAAILATLPASFMTVRTTILAAGHKFNH
jgi:hypothetical protein